jgi:hypothetical protein
MTNTDILTNSDTTAITGFIRDQFLCGALTELGPEEFKDVEEERRWTLAAIELAISNLERKADDIRKKLEGND